MLHFMVMLLKIYVVLMTSPMAFDDLKIVIVNRKNDVVPMFQDKFGHLRRDHL